MSYITGKKPTYDDFINYDGAHCRCIWKSLNNDWRCPGCGRTKFEIMRWTRRFPSGKSKTKFFMGWMAGLHKHHDHAVPWGSVQRERFNEAVVCDQCNSADAIAKRMLSLPDDFSFSPEEIKRFIVATPHEKHKINKCKVMQVVHELKFVGNLAL